MNQINNRYLHPVCYVPDTVFRVLIHLISTTNLWGWCYYEQMKQAEHHLDPATFMLATPQAFSWVNKKQPVLKTTSSWLLPDSSHVISGEGYLMALRDLVQTEKSL